MTRHYKNPGITHYEADYLPQPNEQSPFYPYCIEEAIRHSSCRFHENNCQFMMLVYVVDGDIYYYDEEKTEHYAGKGDIVIIPRYSNYAFATTRIPYYHKFVLEIKGASIPHLAEQMNMDRLQIVQAGTATDAVFKEIKSLDKMIKEFRPETLPDILASTWKILALTAQEIETGQSVSPLLKTAIAFLEGNLSSKFSIAELAAKLGISHTSLNRLFIRELGISPQQYRSIHKMHRAKHYLENTSYSIKEIAARLEYDNQLYFSNDFKKHLGISPKKYRKQTAG
jgi:AraC-like DNA-binding protein